MASRLPALFFHLALFLSAMGVTVSAETHTDCGMVQTAFSFCVAYIAGMENKVSPKCCMGVRAVNDLAEVTRDGPGTCRCLRQLLLSARVPGGSRAAMLPKACGVRTRVVPRSLHDDCA